MSNKTSSRPFFKVKPDNTLEENYFTQKRAQEVKPNIPAQEPQEPKREVKILPEEGKAITRTCEISLEDKNLVFFRYFESIEIDVEDVEENLKATEALLEKAKQYHLIIVPGMYSTITREAREINILDHKHQYFRTEGVVIESLSTRLIMNFYYRQFEHKHPVKFAPSEEAAVHWTRRMRSRMTR